MRTPAPPPFTLGETLRTVALPHAHASLIGPAARERLLALADGLPAGLGSCLHLECRLTGSGGPVDLIVRVDEEGRHLLAGATSSTVPAFRRAGEVARDWAAGDAALASVARLWLEFDAGPPPPPAGAEARGATGPGLFVELREGTHDVAGLVHALVGDETAGAASTRATVATIGRCIAALQPGKGARLYALGAFAPRGDGLVRVCILEPPADALPDYLETIGWHGTTETVAGLQRAIAAGMCEGRRRVGVLHLDVRAGMPGPRVGFEYVLDRGSQLRGRPTDGAMLDALVARGLCTADTRDGLLAWAGAERRRMTHELWPSVVTRVVNHVKLSVADGVCDVKVYLGVSTEPLHRRLRAPAPAHPAAPSVHSMEP